MPQFNEFVSWAFYGLLTFAFFRLDSIMNGLKTAVDDLNLTLTEESTKAKFVKEDVEILRQDLKTLTDRIYLVEISLAQKKGSQ